MGHRLDDQAAKAVKNSSKTQATKETPEELIKKLRGNLNAGLAVPSHQIAALLAGYDASMNHVDDLEEEISGLQGDIDDLRDQLSECADPANLQEVIEVGITPVPAVVPATEGD